jgi:hypothetical protein
MIREKLKSSVVGLFVFFQLQLTIAAPIDIFPVVRSDARVADAMLQSACTSGITYYSGWSKLEPNRGKFNLAGLEKVLDLAKTSGKKINLGILPGRWSPDWVFSSSKNQMRWLHSDEYVASAKNEQSKAVLPWDPNFQHEFKDALIEIGALVGKYPTVVNSVAITGGSNTNGIEMNFIGSDYELKRVGFSPALYISSWKKFIDFYAEAFPQNDFTLAIHTMYGSQRTDLISKEIIAYGKEKLGGRLRLAALAFTEEGWFKPGNQYADLVLNDAARNKPVLQAIRIYSKDKSSSDFRKMISYAKYLKPAWLEVWAEDVMAGYLSCEARLSK